MTTSNALLSDLVAGEIRAMMGRQRVTGARLAASMGVSAAWVSNRLTGAVPIDLNDLQRIAVALQVDPRELFPRSEQSRRHPAALYARLGHRPPARGPRRPLRLHVPIPLAA